LNTRPGGLDRFLTRAQTTSFIIVRNDTTQYEKYFNGYRRDSIVTSFSVAKAFVSVLVGIAVDQGKVKSVTDPITLYLPELERRDPRFNRVTIKDLLRMSSGLRYVEGSPPHDEQRTYMDPNLRRAGLESTNIEDDPGTHWLYNNYNPLLIGMILERVSGRSVTDLLQTEIWRPLGMEYGVNTIRNCAAGDAKGTQVFVKPSVLQPSEPTPLCTMNNSVGSYFLFTCSSRS
jgi:CubicO group peptidase (beta-lactamase class C family)